MMSLEDALVAVDLIKKIAPTTKVRIAFPYTEDLVQKLYDAGYLPAIEHNAWNEVEVVISTSNCIDLSLQSH